MFNYFFFEKQKTNKISNIFLLNINILPDEIILIQIFPRNITKFPKLFIYYYLKK